MQRLEQIRQQKLRRKQRIRATVSGTAERPRMSVHISLRHVSVQLIDDVNHKTLAGATTIGAKSTKLNLTEQAAAVGTDIAKKAKALKIKNVSLDRNGRLYHGRVKALAEAARAEGLEF